MINSTIDCLIAQTAIENNLYLLHNDSDFDNIAKVVDLKMFNL
jgi:predicted nucleic acid-binding protein